MQVKVRTFDECGEAAGSCGGAVEGLWRGWCWVGIRGFSFQEPLYCREHRQTRKTTTLSVRVVLTKREIFFYPPLRSRYPGGASRADNLHRACAMGPMRLSMYARITTYRSGLACARICGITLLSLTLASTRPLGIEAAALAGIIDCRLLSGIPMHAVCYGDCGHE